MSDYFEEYKQRLQRLGDNVGEAFESNTKAFIEANFDASPTKRVMQVMSYQFPNLTTLDARVVEIERMGRLREAVLRPSHFLDIGSYVSFDDEDYLVFDRHGGTGAVNMKLTLARTNRTLKWIDKDNILREKLCIASATDLGSKSRQSKDEIEWNKYDVRLPIGQLFVFVEADPYSKDISLNQRFIFGRNVYEVTGIDDVTQINQDGYGIIQLTIKITTSHNVKDDFDAGIAYNNHDVETNGQGGLW